MIDSSGLGSNISHRIMLRIASGVISGKRKVLITAIVSISVLAIAFLSMYSSINDVFPHLFYVSIILVAFWYPERGMPFSLLMGISYMIEFLICAHILGTVPVSDTFTVASRSLVFLIVGTVLSILRWESYTINSIIGDINKFVFVHSIKQGDFYQSPSIYGLLPDESVRRIRNKGIASTLVKEDQERYEVLQGRALSGEEVSDVFRMKDKDGVLRIMSFTLLPIIRRGEVVGFRGMVDDVTQYKQYEDTIKAALQEKTILLAEVHHRVRNNLAIIIGFINMQLMKMDDDAIRECLMETENRILAISSVHTSVYQNEQMVDIDSEKHFSNMAKQIIENYHSPCPIGLDLDLQPIEMSFNETMDLSLILNELISNAMKHAFLGRSQGRIRISLSKDESALTLIFSDDGIGISDERPQVLGFGLSIVFRMVKEKLNGSIEKQPGPGTTGVIRLPSRDQ